MTPRRAAFRLIGPALALGLLAGCALGYGPVQHSVYTENPSCNPAPGSVAPDSVSPAPVALPLFLVTSRLPDCRDAQSRLLGFRADQLRFGRFAPPLTATLADDAKRPPAMAIVHGDDWWASLGSEAEKRGGRVLLYVHGYREGFATVARDTGQIARLTGFDGPVIAYSWPSQAMLQAYGADEANVYWDQANFRDFLAQLSEQAAVREVVILSHSLGARLLVPGLEYSDRVAARNSGKFRTIILAAPDIDRGEFDRSMANDLLNNSQIIAGRRIHIYVSAKDRALETSRQVHGLPRAGKPDCFNPQDPLLVAIEGGKPRCYPNAQLAAAPSPNRVSALTIIDTSAVARGITGHSDFLRSAVVCRDLAATMRGEAGSGARAVTPLAHVFRLTTQRQSSEDEDRIACRIGS